MIKSFDTTALPASVRDSIRQNDPRDPVARQYLPSPDEGPVRPEERPDPIGDDTHSPLRGLVHRYPDRVLLKIVSACAVYCRFCFRKEMVGNGRKHLDEKEIDTALVYIRSNPKIWEVILTGGDPMILSARRMGGLLKKIEEIPHIQTLRIHTRVPIATPERMTPSYMSALRTEKPLYVSVHVNHAQEITPAVQTALDRLHKAGCVLLSQTVLLRGVNDTVEALEALFRRLVSLRVRPYYLHHCDLAPGTAHFRTSIAQGQALVKALRGRVSGLCQPHYVLDIPGGFGKVSAAPCALHRDSADQWEATDRFGENHAYPDVELDVLGPKPGLQKREAPQTG